MFVAIALLSCIACNSASDLDNSVAAKALLVKFAVKIGNNSYNAVIDHYAGTVKIGALTNLDSIDGVDYLLADNASIAPEPKSFIGKWEKEQTVVVTANGIEVAYDIIFTRYKDPAEERPDDGDGDSEFDYDYRPDFLPKDDECQLYAEPYVAFTAATMPVGAPHPNAALAAAGWKLFTVNEFSDGREATREDGSTVKLPFGLYPFDEPIQNESAWVRNEECSSVENGLLVMKAYHLDAPVKTGKSNQYNRDGEVEYMHASFRTYPSRNPQGMGDWFTLAPNMRVEVRYRRTNTVGFNNAVWFQGNTGSWPANGEIDLMENPKTNVNQTMHSTLHSEHFNSGGPENVRMGPSLGSTLTLDNLTRWYILWLELYPDEVVMGVNGTKVYSYKKGTKVANKSGQKVDNPDWPWDHADGFHMMLTTGMHDKVHSTRNAWQGDVRPIDFEDPDNLPTMEFDWVRVYVNGDYDREEAMGVYY